MKIRIITMCDSKYYSCLLLLWESVKRLGYDFVCWDLGLTGKQIKKLRKDNMQIITAPWQMWCIYYTGIKPYIMAKETLNMDKDVNLIYVDADTMLSSDPTLRLDNMEFDIALTYRPNMFEKGVKRAVVNDGVLFCRYNSHNFWKWAMRFVAGFYQEVSLPEFVTNIKEVYDDKTFLNHTGWWQNQTMFSTIVRNAIERNQVKDNMFRFNGYLFNLLSCDQYNHLDPDNLEYENDIYIKHLKHSGRALLRKL